MAKEKRKVKAKKRKVHLTVTSGVVHIQATFNNTIISITDAQGNVISWSSAGQVGFPDPAKAPPLLLSWQRSRLEKKRSNWDLKKSELM